ncbi:hypothetical protein GW901_00145 [Candidatus Parcubacteria bacterium]|nr:hypothetical protein [Candidatus Parcubacteria bacterium]
MTNNNSTKIMIKLEKLEERIEKLEKAVFNSKVREDTTTLKKTAAKNINFSFNERTFVKRYVVDKSGPKRFTLLLAYLSKGGVNKNIELSEIKKHWNKMTAKTLLGKFNMFYPNDAKTRGWIDSKEYGTYNLTNEWKNVL